MKRLLITSLVLVVLALCAGIVSASGKYGPFHGTSPDSGTCGNDWANDGLDRFGTNVKSNGFTMNFGNGTFVTVAGSSPGACENGDNGNKVANGVVGSFSGFFTVNVQNGEFDPNAVCTQDKCNTTAGFVKTLYGQDATYDTNGPFKFVYTRCDGKQTWQNASKDQGGNVGDIYGNPVACPQPPAPPVEYQPQACGANSTVLAAYIGRRMRVYLVQASGLQELQYEARNFVEAGKVDGQSSGKVSLVFYPKADSWKQFDGQKLLIRIEGYVDGWYWFPKGAPGHPDTLFCDWAPAPGKGFSSKQ